LLVSVRVLAIDEQRTGQEGTVGSDERSAMGEDKSSAALTNDRAVRIVRGFVKLADALVSDFDVVEMLDQLVRGCVELLDVDAAGILLLNQEGALEVAASSNGAARYMEIFQVQSESGPCVEVVRTGRPIVVTERAEIERRWPVFGRAVARVGYSAVYALPMRVRDETIGALNLFSTTPPRLDELDTEVTQALADAATIGIMQQRSITRATLLAEQLQLALNTRTAVEQAKGIVAEYGGVDVGTAFEAIRKFARSHRANLSSVAEQLVARTLDPRRVIPPKRGGS
jgi:transcriptional regulator with GAF, ATPase, and Fis domain